MCMLLHVHIIFSTIFIIYSNVFFSNKIKTVSEILHISVQGKSSSFHIYFYFLTSLLSMPTLFPEIRLAPSVAAFKKKLTAKIRSPAKPVFGIHDPISLSHLTQFRVGLSKLNLHKFQHNFRDTVDPMCPSNDGNEDTEHFLLLTTKSSRWSFGNIATIWTRQPFK